MRIFNENKTQEIRSYDLAYGWLREDKLFVAHHAASEKREESGHWETKKTYPNGGKDVLWVVDVPACEASPAYDEYEDIYVYVPYTQEELAAIAANKLRARRAGECFPVVNRGVLWYEKLSEAQKTELSEWYEAWLDAPATGIAPEAPAWLTDPLPVEDKDSV